MAHEETTAAEDQQPRTRMAGTAGEDAAAGPSPTPEAAAAAEVADRGERGDDDERARGDAAAGDAPDDAGAADEGPTREELLEALNAAESSRDEFLDHLQRTQAEFQNFRKRMMREGAMSREQGIAEVLTRLIDVVDDFELAVLAADSSDTETLRKGVEMVYGKLVDVLRSFGLEKVAEEGVPFDPEIHDAVQQVDDGEERAEPVVAEVFRPGYRTGGKVLRPAMVKVAK